MSFANLGYSAGSKFYGMVAERSTYVESYVLLSLFVVALVFVLLFHRHGEEAASATRRKITPRHTIAIGGSEAGLFWSGVMRCPKCRSYLEQIKYDGVEVDRCVTCSGIWFDDGELELLRNKKAAAAIDIGDSKRGAELNAIDGYRCPRCGDAMARVVDARQRHIWYETCRGCNGSFFDAGEFLDLSQLTLSDFFKVLVAPKR